MALTAYGKNAALKGFTEKAKYLGLFTAQTFALTSNTVIGASLINMTGAKAKGFTNGTIVALRKLTGSITGLLEEGRYYYVVGEVTNGFELAYEEGGAGIKVAGHELETATTEVSLLTEVTGGSYARVATTWGSAANGEVSDTAAEAIKVPASTTVTDAGWWEKSSGGSGATGLFAAVKLEHAETFTGEGEYKVTSDKLEANPVA